MLQRIQSVWLLLAGIAILLTLNFTTLVVETADLKYAEQNGLNSGVAITIVTVLIGLLSFIIIGLYKNRVLQLRLCVVGIVLELVLLFLYYKKATEFTNHSINIMAVLHVLVILLFVLAARGINSDEKLIKQSDRLR